MWNGAGSGCSRVRAEARFPERPGLPARMVADVSAIADPSTGVAVLRLLRRSRGWLVFGGTSVSAPIVASIFRLTGHGAGTAAAGLREIPDSSTT